MARALEDGKHMADELADMVEIANGSADRLMEAASVANGRGADDQRMSA